MVGQEGGEPSGVNSVIELLFVIVDGDVYVCDIISEQRCCAVQAKLLLQTILIMTCKHFKKTGDIEHNLR